MKDFAVRVELHISSSGFILGIVQVKGILRCRACHHVHSGLPPTHCENCGRFEYWNLKDLDSAPLPLYVGSIKLCPDHRKVTIHYLESEAEPEDLRFTCCNEIGPFAAIFVARRNAGPA